MEDQAMSLQRLIWSQITRRKLCKHTKAPTASMWGEKKKRQIFTLIPKKKSIVKTLYTQWEADRHICVNLFEWQSSNLEWWWLGTALGSDFGDGKRHDYIGSWSNSKKSRNYRFCNGSYARPLPWQCDKHPSKSPSQLVGLSHWRIKLFGHMPDLKISPPVSAAPSALPAPWEHRPLLLQWGKTTKRTGLPRIDSSDLVNWTVLLKSDFPKC